MSPTSPFFTIECCEGCDRHQTTTRHNEKKYHSMFEACKEKIQELIPGATVAKNIKWSFTKKINEHAVRPGMGAFEIYTFHPKTKTKITFFSKLKTLNWPDISAIAERTKGYVDDRQ